MTGEDEVPGRRKRLARGEGTIEGTVNPAAYARMLCLVTHPIALDLGTIAPGVPCCSACAFAYDDPDSEGPHE